MNKQAITTGHTPMGLRWARYDRWRVVAYAEGGYSVGEYVPGFGLCLEDANSPAPDDVVFALCDTLGIES